MKRSNRTEQIFMTAIDSLTPSCPYISADKLKKVQSWFQGNVTKMDPIPVRKLAGRLFMTDGHTRAAAAVLCGAKSLPCIWEADDLDWAAYAGYLNICKEEGITSAVKLADRIVSDAEYRRLWNDRCDALYDEWYYKVLKQDREIIFYTCQSIPLAQYDIRQSDMRTDDSIDYFQLYDHDVPVARGCIERYSYEFWEAADIKTFEGYRGHGFGFIITAYLTNKIIASGRTATCRTLPRNAPMLRVIEKCGYQKLYD